MQIFVKYESKTYTIDIHENDTMNSIMNRFFQKAMNISFDNLKLISSSKFMVKKNTKQLDFSTGITLNNDTESGKYKIEFHDTLHVSVCAH